MRASEVETFLKERLPSALTARAGEINYGRGMGIAVFTKDGRCVVEEFFGWKHRNMLFAGMEGTELTEPNLTAFTDAVRLGYKNRPELD